MDSTHVANRNYPEHHHHQQIGNSNLVCQTISAIRQLIVNHPDAFDIDFLSSQRSPISLETSVGQLYKDTKDLYQSNNILFDEHRHWNIAWRQALSFDDISELADGDNATVIRSFHPRSHKAISTIYEHALGRYMRWYPWQWFSDLVFLGAGGFSAVYAARVRLPYDIPEKGERFGSRIRPVALKVVDEKILNEITVQSRAFVALLFHGLTVCETTGDLMMVATLSEDGNLDTKIQRPLNKSHDFSLVSDMVTQLAFDLASLHDEIGMCHRNIHPRNILCSDEDCLLVDYRFSTASNEASTVTRASQAYYGRIPYIAPEISRGDYTEKSDVFSLGVVMWQLISGVSFPSAEIMLDAPEIYRIEWIPGVPHWYMELIMACLEPRPENRPEAEEIGLIVRNASSPLRHAQLQQDWADYVQHRRERCKLHWNQLKSATYKKSHGKPDIVLDMPDTDQGWPASRVYALADIPAPETFVNLPFHDRPFDTSNILAFIAE
ncbi:mitogen-activated protein kinase kinase kinase 9 [Apophysomyces ossiformis]|uniref:Mitogen-activated protein kinase kinase kinase 9 n=1 Tax=Apophysomyces ossiformis TaxID=679940 RepID=A0A8H7ENI9_9FUNG|nr:mitogen-activated protein kinase kinase kinase 9 [Apophysomyces ossiformis]